MNEFMQPSAPVPFEGRNFRRQYRERTAGSMYLIQIEVAKEFWDACEAIPRDSIIQGAISWTDGDEKVAEPTPEEKPKVKVQKGPYGAFWQVNIVGGLKEHPKLLAWASEAGKPVLDYLRGVFEVPSLTHVSPEKAREWAWKHELFDLFEIFKEVEKSLGAHPEQ